MGTGYVPSWWEISSTFLQRCDWELKFALLPHRCVISNKLIWLKHAYRGIRVITGPGEPIIESHWLTKEEFVIWRLKYGTV